MARQRAFLWVSAYHPLTRLAASHLSRQGANYGQRVGAAIGKCFRLILNKFARYEGRYVLQQGADERQTNFPRTSTGIGSFL
jgi:hypothetical protein